MRFLAGHPHVGALLGDPGIAAIFAPERDVGRMLHVEAAWTRVIAPPSEVGRLSDAIETAIIDQAALGAATARDGVPVPELVRQLKA
ncbi:MAG: 3-carboxy-cis,cis-muconate cycloisomerase, partial [Pseudomonadota bacterium]